MRREVPQHEPCDDYVDIGPFRFECAGHLPGVVDRARQYHNGKITHRSSSREDVGDVNVEWWSMADPEPGAGQTAGEVNDEHS